MIRLVYLVLVLFVGVTNPIKLKNIKKRLDLYTKNCVYTIVCIQTRFSYKQNCIQSPLRTKTFNSFVVYTHSFQQQICIQTCEQISYTRV